MTGWIIPPPRKATKNKEQFEIERAEKVNQLVRKGFLKSKRIREALLKVLSVAEGVPAAAPISETDVQETIGAEAELAGS